MKTGEFGQNVGKAFWSQSWYQRALLSTSLQSVMLVLTGKTWFTYAAMKTWSQISSFCTVPGTWLGLASYRHHEKYTVYLLCG